MTLFVFIKSKLNLFLVPYVPYNIYITLLTLDVYVEELSNIRPLLQYLENNSNKMHCIPLPQYFFSTYYSQPYFRLKELDKLMHYMVPLFFYTYNFVIEEVLHYIEELYKFYHK